MTTSLDFRREVIEENFGDLGATELSGFLAEVIEQFRADLRSICEGGPAETGAALHRVAGSAPSVGCVSLGRLARTAMAHPPVPTPPELVSALQAALFWLEDLLKEVNLNMGETKQ